MFPQYAYDDVLLYHFVYEYEDKSDDDGYQWSERKWTVYGIHRPNKFKQILFLMKIDAQRESEIGEKQSKHQTWQREDNVIYIFCICINKDNKITISIRRKKGSRTPYITKN
jgi:hypothetical protein